MQSFGNYLATVVTIFTFHPLRPWLRTLLNVTKPVVLIRWEMGDYFPGWRQ